MLENNSRITFQKSNVVVIIPYYNGSRFIERSAVSVLNQTVKPDEFIVVNDGSTHTETAFLHDLAKRLRFKVIDKENGGQGSARNLGVSKSTADYISFLDQDDFYLQTHIETLLNARPRNDPHLGWVYGDLFEAEGDGGVVRTGMLAEYGAHPKQNIYDLLRNDMFVLPSASLIARKAFEAVGGFDPQFMGYEDDDLFLRIFRQGYTNYFTAVPVTVWCIHTESTSYGIRMTRSRFKYFKKLLSMFPDDSIKKRFYLRDVLIPRFHGVFMGEAINAIMRREKSSPQMQADHKNEFVDILKEYSRIIYQNAAVSRSFKLKLRAQVQIISFQSRILLASSQYAVAAKRRLFQTSFH